MPAIIVATYRPDRPAGSTPSGALARLEGKLEAQGGCLVVAPDGPAAPVVQPVFPQGKARWDDVSRKLTYNGAPYGLGSTIVLGGGGVGDPQWFRAQPGAMIPECAAAELFVVND